MSELGGMVELLVPVADLAARCDPFDGEEWGCDPIDPDAVLRAAASGRLESEPWQVVNARRRGDRSFDDAAWHVGRIAFLLVNADLSPLELEVETVPGGPREVRRVRMYAGNHRFAAAMLRSDETVKVRVPFQELDDMLDLLPGARTAPCAPCAGTGREDNHVTGEVECSACEGSGVEILDADAESEAGGPTP
jgi:hypothetical protein